MKLSLFLALIGGSALAGTVLHSGPEGDADVGPFVHWLLDDGERLEDVRFAEVVEAASGCRVLPVDRTNEIDLAVLTLLETTLDAMLVELSRPEDPIHEVGRVNEISRHIEQFLLARLDAAEGYHCGVPPNASGEMQRAGYPDLRLVHESSGRVFYIDPKVYKKGSEQSRFRTFYYEPKRATNKILEDASHLIVGVAHSGKVAGRWRLASWTLVDLVDFRVRLKAEFQSSNRELYRDEAVLRSSRDESTAPE